MSFSEHKTEPLESSNFAQITSSHLFGILPSSIQNIIQRTTYSPSSCIQTIQLPNERNASIHLILYDFAENPDIYLQPTREWLQFVSSFANINCSKHLDVYLVLTDAEKHLPESSDIPIGPEHANTAFTRACSLQNEIFVFRREEWFKVFIHETFHAFGLDFLHASFSTMKRCNRSIRSLFPAIDPTLDIRIYETYCELWAELLQILFTSGGSLAKFNQLWKREKEFAIGQAKKVLQHSGVTYAELMDSSSNHKYTESTSVLSYYVFRSAILWNTPKFIQWCNRNNKKHILQFSLKEDNIAQYCALVRECCIDKQFVRAMETMHGHITDTTLRMQSMGH